jgi:cytochrome c oxidase subunit 3
MMFAGLTSAYIVKGSLPGWSTIEIPRLFYYSTAVILLSSVSVQVALKAFKERSMPRYRQFITVTAILGTGFVTMQILAFMQLWDRGLTLQGSAGAGQFLYIIFGLHALHVIGGVIALLIMFIKAFSSRVRNYDPVSVELASTYWHFVDALWIYLFIFFVMSI